jgi:hypothetical protein
MTAPGNLEALIDAHLQEMESAWKDHGTKENE